ncbi:MAG: hypothetical protein P4L46_16290 [Fimbriimonas sp.]|nr:hypothetical protein [Fimbriimonas sp.]
MNTGLGWVLSSIVVGAIAFGIGGSSAAIARPQPGQAGIERFMKVKTWRLTVQWGLAVHTNETVDSTTHTYSDDLASKVEFKLTQSDDTTSDMYMWRVLEANKPVGTLSYAGDHLDTTKRSDGTTYWTRNIAKAAGIDGGDARFEINPRNGEFRLFAFAHSAPWSMELSNSEGGKATMPMPGMSLSTSRGDWTDKVPATGTKILGKTRQVLCTTVLAADGKQTMDVSWSLSPWEMEPPGESTFQFADKDWMPEPGKPCGFDIKWKGKAEQVRAKLTGISHETGTCLNSQKTGDEDDLRLDAQGTWVIDHQGSASGSSYTATFVVPDDNVKTVHIDVNATDYGGWGKLKVEVFMGGEWKEAKESTTGKSTVNVPYDIDGNHIADFYEKKFGVEGAPANEDKDSTPAGDGSRDGDGLTVYEEYRGFMEGGEHIRTNPKVKDLFLSDQSGGMAAAGADLFHAISGIEVHRKLTADELGGTRVINRNHKEGPHIVDQHGIPITVGPAESDAEAIAADADKGFGPPVMTTHINVPKGGKYSRAASGPVDKSAEDNISTIAHELGHCVGIRHHGEGVFYALWFIWKDANGNPHVHESLYDPSAGKPTGEIKEIHIFRESGGPEVLSSLAGIGSFDSVLKANRVLVAQRPSPYTGQENCVMRYTDPDAYIAPNKPADYRCIPGPTTWVRRNALCSSPEGTGINATGHSPWPRYGDATVGNCQRQIVVSDKYAN